MTILWMRRVLTVAWVLWPAPAASQDFEFTRPADGVTAAISTNLSMGNATVFSGTEASLVVDAHIVPGLAELVYAEAEKTLPPIRTVVNTHWHADHSHGNTAYRRLTGGAVTILAHVATAQGIRNEAADQLANWPTFYQSQIDEQEAAVQREGISAGERDFRNAWLERARVYHSQLSTPDFTAPTRTITGDTEVDLGGRSVQLLHTPGHTEGDIVVWDPDTGVLAAGDLILDNVFMGIDSPRTYRASLARLRALAPLWIVPGHGPVMRGTEALDTHIAGLDRMIEAVAAAVADGMDLDATIAHVTPLMEGTTVARVELAVTATFQEATEGR